MYRYGLKLWSINTNYIKDAINLYERGRYAYIELFIVPGSFDTHIAAWVNLDIPFILHAPHSMKGLNPARRELESRNLKLAGETFRFADKLAAEIVIFHPGVEGMLEETVRQMKLMADDRIVVENKPHFGIGNIICNGTSPDEISLVMNEAGVGFCLDIGHAICAANARKVAPLDYINDFCMLRPKMYHLSDGSFDGNVDEHLHFGDGDYDLATLLAYIPDDSLITVETDKDSKENLDDFERDIVGLDKIVYVLRT